MTRQEPVREPKQQRSQERVAQILTAAREVIRQKGAANMSMNEIAAVAGISVGSIYQYFANRGAVVVALAEEILDANLKANKEVLAQRPKSLTHLSHLMMELLDRYYDLHRRDPVVVDIWAGYLAHKALNDADHEDDLRNRDAVFEACCDLFDEGLRETAKRNLLLLIKLGNSAVQHAAQLEIEEGQATIAETKVILYAAWEASILPLARVIDSSTVREAQPTSERVV